ncbi:MAG: Transcription antitermination protein nusG [Candidatus Collierbacteria bacterium GW2011_GWB1_44_6]|uniref:Transcription termination/antitermination protein NusG n=2 Tax=Candidatus Collieribacteriota TaxID=1752725 RepID=A0A0G1LXL1_9BACT|nr:MAG: Transcription antitermination protein nusG [Candidatus Collierbacteria bacterium GW2011_GWC2_43_12]KKT73562.1 MAG: Transcription antitermination protein nusG [Candidatus Collierbacteria bacterium GW2011_GWB1_44_6]KKT83015.1 MAG: NusG antitermination factor, transcriptional antiterminator NusG [Microgenomates group bacterium GW2011_GWC1_44_9]
MKLKVTDQKQTPEDLIQKVEDPNHIVVTTDAPASARWYVVHTQSGHENRVAITLKTRVESMGLTHNIFEILIPTQEKIKISKGKKVTIKEKLFPGYMLVRMIVTDDAWLAVRTTQGVTGFVGTADQPTPLPENEVKAITAFGEQAAPKFQSAYTVGEAVRIIEGPFTDLLGTVSAIDEAKGKIVVLVSIFGRETPVELDFLQVSKI